MSNSRPIGPVAQQRHAIRHHLEWQPGQAGSAAEGGAGLHARHRAPGLFFLFALGRKAAWNVRLAQAGGERHTYVAKRSAVTRPDMRIRDREQRQTPDP
jgi:hypothetical protein